MNIFDSLRNGIKGSSGAFVISIDQRANMMSSAEAVFGDDVVNWAKAMVRDMDCDPKSDHRIGTCLMSLHESLTKLSDIEYMYEAVPERLYGVWGAPTPEGRRAIARQAQINLSKAAFLEAATEMVHDFPEDTKLVSYMWYLCGREDLRNREVSTADRERLKAVLKGSK
jgi:hypothetical protein